MQWSKRKKNAEQFFADSVRGRVELRSTHYRGTHDEEGRGYITFDGEEIWSMCTVSFDPIEYELTREIVERDGVTKHEASLQANLELTAQGTLSQYTFYDSLDAYCDNSIAVSLRSDNVLIRSLAMLDARVGKRRLEKFDAARESDIVTRFYRIRCQCERLPF